MKTLIIFVLSLVSLLPALSQAYKQADIVKLNTPHNTPIKMLLGYNSKTGKLVERCLKPVTTKRQPGADPSGAGRFTFTRSMQDILNEHSLDVSAKVSVQFGAVGGSVSTDYSEFSRNRDKVERGMMYGTYTDLVRPMFSNPNAQYQFNKLGKEQYQKSIKRRGNLKKFEKECGDAVIIGTQEARFIQVYGWYKNTSSLSESKQEIGVKAAVSYMNSKASVDVNNSDYAKDIKDSENLEIRYYPSGNAIAPGAGSLDSLKSMFEGFSNLPLSQTGTTLYMYIVPYKDLLPPGEFNLGLSRKKLKQVNTIVDGTMALEHAKNVIASKARKEKNAGLKKSLIYARMALKRELKHIQIKMMRNKGCIGIDNLVCKNLEQRFNNYINSSNRTKINRFINRRIASSKHSCAQGYPVTAPSGQAMCQQCPLGKQPVFLNRHEGACRYVAKKVASGAKRIWVHQLKKSKKVQQEAGVTSSVAEYPNTCNKNAKKCGKPIAKRLCQDRGFSDVADFKIWRPGGYALSRAVPRTIYKDGSRCKPNLNGFTRKACLTFLYIDCEQ